MSNKQKRLFSNDTVRNASPSGTGKDSDTRNGSLPLTNPPAEISGNGSESEQSPDGDQNSPHASASLDAALPADGSGDLPSDSDLNPTASEPSAGQPVITEPYSGGDLEDASGEVDGLTFEDTDPPVPEAPAKPSWADRVARRKEEADQLYQVLGNGPLSKRLLSRVKGTDCMSKRDIERKGANVHVLTRKGILKKVEAPAAVETAAPVVDPEAKPPEE